MTGPPAAAPATLAEAERFFEETEATLLGLQIESNRADWVHATYITPDSAALAARASARVIETTMARAKAARRFDALALPEALARKSYLLRTALPLVAPGDAREAEELSGLVNGMQAIYATGRIAMPGASEPLDLEAIGRLLARSRDSEEQLAAWSRWHDVATPMKPTFVRYVDLANRGARELGFDDLGALWRAKYDMSPAQFDAEVERLWQQVEPLYRSLHAFVRARLRAQYGDAVVPARGAIPAHLLGNMWAQSWENLLPILRAGPGGGEALTQALLRQGATPRSMVEFGERFFVSLGLPKLPATFWERSMLTKPRDREVVCHASAWDIDYVEDLRIKMCIDVAAEDFRVIHHELGHNYYQRAYSHLPFLFRDGAHDGFHEAIGDTVLLSITPEYLRQIGLSEGVPAGDDIGFLLERALESIAFLPFGLLIDRWRWRVFDGTIPPEEYNRSWWEMRRAYQGIAPAAERPADRFDAGAKYHVAANVPYMRYFLADILHFQFHRALARSIGWDGPIHRASIYGRSEAGRPFAELLAMGASRPWPEALEALTGERRMDAGAIREYFRPLSEWLDEQLRGESVGW
jgi:peptidyl-dipeptidase A